MAQQQGNLEEAGTLHRLKDGWHTLPSGEPVFVSNGMAVLIEMGPPKLLRDGLRRWPFVHRLAPASEVLGMASKKRGKPLPGGQDVELGTSAAAPPNPQARDGLLEALVGQVKAGLTGRKLERAMVALGHPVSRRTLARRLQDLQPLVEV